jgi:uncharacterized membrane protein YkvA (DUF1232 family)
LSSAWRDGSEGVSLLHGLQDRVDSFKYRNKEHRRSRNIQVARLRSVMQRVALRHLKPDLVILDEVQRFREVLDEAGHSTHVASELFTQRVPVLILSATPYRALTLGHEMAMGASSHHDDFISTLKFLFGSDKETPRRIQENLRKFGERLEKADLLEARDGELLRLKEALEADLTKVMCRTERNWYVLDRRKGVEDTVAHAALPNQAQLHEYFRLHRALSHASPGIVTEFWKSAPSLLTFLDTGYQMFRSLRDTKSLVSRSLLTPANEVSSLADRNHRITRVVDTTLGPSGTAPRLWMAPTYSYYRDELYGGDRPRKMLVFSGWRFVPKTVAVVASRVAAERMGGDSPDPSQPLRFSDRLSFHTFDVCFPAPFLAEVGHRAFVATRSPTATANDVLAESERILREELRRAGIAVRRGGGHPMWQVAMRLEQLNGNASLISSAMRDYESVDEEGSSMHFRAHAERIDEWLNSRKVRLELSEHRVRHLGLVAAFSPANSLLRSFNSVYEGNHEQLSIIAAVTLGDMRRFFNRPHVRQIIRIHQPRLKWRHLGSEDRGFAESVLIYSADGHLQAVLDEFVYLMRHAGQATSPKEAASQLASIWALARGTARTNGATGDGPRVRIKRDAESHATHFALAFGEDVSRDQGIGSRDTQSSSGEPEKLRKNVVREAFNSPFWPFVLATTSVGQEGLDFHLYCRDVLHWNLPSNPVDLEQREGRVNRRDCLAVRESIARDWPLTRERLQTALGNDGRNPWSHVFDVSERADATQKYKHGLFPHWVYECRDPQQTVRIQRHVPFFTTSRDAVKYERLKAGLALYRLVFGQMNQEDLIDSLSRRTESLAQSERDRLFRRLTGYMLNLSPITHEVALRHAVEEADQLLADPDQAGLYSLIESVRQLQKEHSEELAVVQREIDALAGLLEGYIKAPKAKRSGVRKATAALAYLRNPYDHIFDQHVEGGFADDVEVIRKAWSEIQRQ